MKADNHLALFVFIVCTICGIDGIATQIHAATPIISKKFIEFSYKINYFTFFQ